MMSDRKHPHGISYSSTSSSSPRIFFLVLLAVLLAHPTLSQAQSHRNNFGKEFYVTYPANYGADEFHSEMALYLTSRVAAKVNVAVPGLNYNQNFTTTPGLITTVILPSDTITGSVEIRQSEVILPGMAVHITSDTDIAVYGVDHKQYSSDAFMGLPTNVLGTEYRAMSFQTSLLPNGQGPFIPTPGEFVIVGIDSATHVTITPKALTAGGAPQNLPISIVLQAGDVYMVQGDPTDPTNDLTGSLIESDLPIAVFSGHKRTDIPQNYMNQLGGTSRNNLVEQMPPVSAWGDSALVIPYNTSPDQAEMPDLVRIISAEDNNQIKVNGAVVATLMAGDFYEIPALSSVTSINATNPILVGQYMHTSYGGNAVRGDSYGDPCLAIDFPVEQFDTEYTIISVVNDAFTGNFVNLTVPASGIASMTLDGALIPAASFTPIAGSIYEYARITLQQGTHNLYCKQPFGATVYGLGVADAYAYTGGSQIKTITPLKTVDLVIDFKDRLLQAGTLAGKFDTTVPITNISSDPVDVYGYPRRTGDTSKFYVTAPTPSQSTPEVINSGATDSITIEFQPLEANRRMHTQLIAKTIHLRAYVVDLYGRGVLDSPQFYSDSSGSLTVDTVDFGTWTATDPVRDTIIYLANNGTSITSITSMLLSGAESNYFQQLSGIPPFTIDTGRTAGAKPEAIKLQFNPATPGPNGLKTAILTVTSASGSVTKVVLIARIETISAASLTLPTFDTLLTCNNEIRSISIQNANDRIITLDSVVVTGVNPGDFAVTTTTPLQIGAISNANVDLNFQPGASGQRSARVTLYFDFPKGTVDSFTVTGFGTISNLIFSADTGVHILGGENFTIAVRALTDLGPFRATGYTLQLAYDSTYISFQNEGQDNTHSYFGYFTPSGIPGHELLTYQCIQDSVISGGGVGDSIPLINLQFSSSSSAGAASTVPNASFSAKVMIGVDVQLQNAILKGPCITSNSANGYVFLDSTCGSPGVIVADGAPLLSGMDTPTPNPFTTSTIINYGIAHAGQVRILITDVLGRPVEELLNAWMKPGYYSTTFNASSPAIKSGMFYVTLYAGDQVKTRKLILAK